MPSNPLRVLLLLDVQVAPLADPPAGVPSSVSIRRNIEQVLNSARNAHPPPVIIHVRNTGDAGDADEPKTPGWELLYAPLPHEHVVDKLKNNAFTGTELGDLIHPHAEIVIIGLLSDFALNRVSLDIFVAGWVLIPSSLQRCCGSRQRSPVDTGCSWDV